MEHSSKIKFYLSIAKEVSKASYCERSKVGAVIVKDDNIISFGYNGTISGFSNVNDSGLQLLKKSNVQTKQIQVS